MGREGLPCPLWTLAIPRGVASRCCARDDEGESGALGKQKQEIATPRYAGFASPCLVCTLMVLRAVDPRLPLLWKTRMTSGQEEDYPAPYGDYLRLVDKNTLAIICFRCNDHCAAVRAFNIFLDVSLYDDLFCVSGVSFAFVAYDLFVFLSHCILSSQ